ncbi:hypothetical protein [Paracoccus yeei]|uniref:Uncharacterized protein n=1 Tax=Paracoccus yeei TaxID=147645 RepID=A0A5P2QUP1_9RHOB|nr:hypothetical protein [Paracoccus yeei]QEU09817.1 hypothetical protein FOB51_18410 [Paracoccus yeei]
MAAVPALAEVETPIAALYGEWEKATRAVELAMAEGKFDDDEFDVIVGAQTDIEDQISRMKPMNLRDLAMKLYARASAGKCDLPPSQYCPGLWDEARELISA